MLKVIHFFQHSVKVIFFLFVYSQELYRSLMKTEVVKTSIKNLHKKYPIWATNPPIWQPNLQTYLLLPSTFSTICYPIQRTPNDQIHIKPIHNIMKYANARRKNVIIVSECPLQSLFLHVQPLNSIQYHIALKQVISIYGGVIFLHISLAYV